MLLSLLLYRGVHTNTYTHTHLEAPLHNAGKEEAKWKFPQSYFLPTWQFDLLSARPQASHTLPMGPCSDSNGVGARDVKTQAWKRKKKNIKWEKWNLQMCFSLFHLLPLLFFLLWFDTLAATFSHELQIFLQISSNSSCKTTEIFLVYTFFGKTILSHWFNWFFFPFAIYYSYSH